MNNFVIIEERKPFKGIIDNKLLLDRSQSFKMMEGKIYQLCSQEFGKKIV